MKSVVIALALVTVCAQSSMATVLSKASVKVVLHDTATVMADDNGFFTLGEISDISGGTPELRDKLGNVEVGRAPLDSYTRHLELGDVALKLRQAGIDPNRDLKLTGAENIVVSTAAKQVTVKSTPAPSKSTTASTASQAASQSTQVVIKRNDPVTIVLQDGNLTVTALGQSRDNGAVGDMIHAHRDGIVTDILAQVVDNHTVQMEL